MRTIATLRTSPARRCLEQVEVDLARAEHDAIDLPSARGRRSRRAPRGTSRVVSSSSFDTDSLWRSRLFGVMTMSGLRNDAQHLPAQHVEHLRGRRRHAHRHVVLGAELQEALEARRGVLGTLPFVAVRQEQRQPADATPLGLARGDELVDDDLRAIGEVAELAFPDHEAVRDRWSSSRTRSRGRLLPTGTSPSRGNAAGRACRCLSGM